jgi:hypothetical protein
MALGIAPFIQAAVSTETADGGASTEIVATWESGGTFTNTQSNDNSYFYGGSDNSNNDFRGYLEVYYDLSALGISASDINTLTFNVTYCHSGNTAPPACGALDPAEGTVQGSQDVEIYNFTSSSWVDIGDLSQTTSDTESTDSFTVSSGFTDYINSTDWVRFRVEADYDNGGFGIDSWLLIDYAPLDVDYTAGDANPPSNVSFVSPTPANGSVVTVSYVYINVSVGDDINVDTANLEWDGVNESMTKVGSGTNVSFFVNKTDSNGNHTYRVWASDNSSNWNVSESRVVNISAPPDLTPPSAVTFVSPTPANNSDVVFTSVTINVSVIDDVAVDSALLEWEGVNQSMTKVGSGPTVTFNVINSSLVNATTYTYRVWANDTSNNWKVSETRVFTVSISIPPFTANDTGRYNLSFNTSVEIETGNLSQSCWTAGGGAGCHLANNSWDADYGTDPRTTINGAPHPGAERSPAGFYPEWVHWHHGGTNWPQWQTADEAYNSATISAPRVGTQIGGKGDAQIGSGFDLAIERTLGEDARSGPSGINVGAIGRPESVDDAQSQRTCAYGSQGGGSPNDADNTYTGCHGISSPYNGAFSVTRTDTITCTNCHISLPSQMSTNSKHNVDANATCAECHYDGTGISNASAPQLGEDATIIPTTKFCTDGTCHDDVTKANFVLKPEGAHAGGECRYCHGWGMNVTRDYSWNKTCGNTDDICHSTGAPTVRAIGGGANFLHGSTKNNVTCNDCHIQTGQTAHNITIPSCTQCHNNTGLGNASISSSSRYGATGDTRSNTVPNWDRNNNIYHGDLARGNVGGMNCTFCHIPELSATSLNTGKIHYINTTQDSGKNYVPDCQDSRCHGNSTTQPTGEATWINYSHGETALAGTGFELECVDCHNNNTVYFINNDTVRGELNYTRTINTFLHTGNTSAYNITPYNTSRLNPGTNNGSVSNAVCKLCHNASQYVTDNPTCENCHTGANGVLEIHDPDMGQASVTLDGVMEAGNQNCIECHDIGGTVQNTSTLPPLNPEFTPT